MHLILFKKIIYKMRKKKHLIKILKRLIDKKFTNFMNII